jgi:hypothetical protein
LNSSPAARSTRITSAPSTTRPDCRFGWRWSWTEGPRPEELEFAAAVLVTNLEEDILSDRYGLPDDCAADEVTWF